MGSRQVLDDAAAHAANRHTPFAGRGRRVLEGRRSGGPGPHVLLGDPPAWAGPDHGGDIDAELVGNPAHERRGFRSS